MRNEDPSCVGYIQGGSRCRHLILGTVYLSSTFSHRTKFKGSSERKELSGWLGSHSFLVVCYKISEHYDDHMKYFKTYCSILDQA